MKFLFYSLIISQFIKINLAFSQENNSYLSSQAYSKTWLNLLHYTQSSPYISSVTNEEFFLTKDGRTNPESELVATIKKLNDDIESQCRFLARTYYLKKQGFLKTEATCVDYLDWKKTYAPNDIEINFATQYISNASSAFGHNFLSIQSNIQPRNLYMTFSFMADVTDDRTIQFIWKGVTGGFTGRFLLLPMYERLHNYNKIENRGLWNYTLDLSEDEKEFAYRYLWENLKYGQKKYYFSTQNCASEIFHFIDTIKDTKNAKPLVYLMPLDVIRHLNGKNLVKKFTFSPSQNDLLNQNLERLSGDEKTVIKKIIDTKNYSTPEKLNVQELDALIEYLQYYKIKNGGKLPPAEEKYWSSLLSARAKIKITSKNESPQRTPPHLIHPPQRFSYSIMKNNHIDALNISYRPIFHSHTDPIYGFELNSDIELFNSNLQLQKNGNDSYKLKLEGLVFANFNNFVPINTLEIAPSWGVTLSYNDQTIGENFESNKFLRVEGRLGLALISLKNWNWILFGRTLYDAGKLKDSHHFNIGPQSLLIYYLKNSQLTLNTSIVYNPTKEATQHLKSLTESKLTYSLSLKNGSQIEFGISHRKSTQKKTTETNQLELDHSLYF